MKIATASAGFLLASLAASAQAGPASVESHQIAPGLYQLSAFATSVQQEAGSLCPFAAGQSYTFHMRIAGDGRPNNLHWAVDNEQQHSMVVLHVSRWGPEYFATMQPDHSDWRGGFHFHGMGVDGESFNAIFGLTKWRSADGACAADFNASGVLTGPAN